MLHLLLRSTLKFSSTMLKRAERKSPQMGSSMGREGGEQKNGVAPTGGVVLILKCVVAPLQSEMSTRAVTWV